MTLRNQTQYFYYKIDAVESGPNSVGTVAGGIYTPFAATNLSNNTNLPLSQLFVQLGSHDRTIVDESALQPDRSAHRVLHRLGPPQSLLLGLEIGWDSYRNQGYARALPFVRSRIRRKSLRRRTRRRSPAT